MILRIGIYVETVKVSAKTGISRYVIGLVEALISLQKESVQKGASHSEHTFFLYYQKTSFWEKELDWLQGLPNVVHKAIYSPNDLASHRPRAWWDIVLPFHLWKDRIDVFHGPNHFLPKTRVPTLLTIHDIAYYYMTVHGEGLDRILKQWTQQSMQRASMVTTVSNATRSDCIKEGIDATKIMTIYQGFESSKKGREMPLPAFIESPYILFLGTLQPRKNVPFLVQAFAKVKHMFPHRLVLAGAKADSTDEIEQLIIEHELKERVILTDYISDEQRISLYQHADCFVYPSKYEGFGLVVLEAMSYEVPVIATNNSSLPEACGEAGVLVDDTSPEELAEKLVEVLTNNELREHLIKKGKSHASSFTWQSCAKQVMRCYEKIGLQ